MFLAYLPLGCVQVLFIHPCTLYWFTGVTKLHPAWLLGIIILLDDSKNIKIDAAKSIPKFKEKTTLKYKTYLPKLSQTLLWFMSRKFGFPFMSGVKKSFKMQFWDVWDIMWPFVHCPSGTLASLDFIARKSLFTGVLSLLFFILSSYQS